jgi:hypothetical protein
MTPFRPATFIRQLGCALQNAESRSPAARDLSRFLSRRAAKTVHGRNKSGHARDNAEQGLLDLGFAKFDVLLGHRIVFLFDQFIGHSARILACHVIETGVRAGHELDLDRRILGHETLGIAAFAAT